MDTKSRIWRLAGSLTALALSAGTLVAGQPLAEATQDTSKQPSRHGSCTQAERIVARIDQSQKKNTVVRYYLKHGSPHQRWSFHLKITYFYRDQNGNRLGTDYDADGTVRLNDDGRRYLGSVKAPKSSRKPFAADAHSNGESCHIRGVIKASPPAKG